MIPALALCGSNPTGESPFSCALRTATGLHAAGSPSRQRGDLATLVAQTCRAHDVAPADLRELRIDLGPGSYTGLRVAVTFARTLAEFDGLVTLGVDTLALLVAAAGSQPPDRRVFAVLDARRERWHRAIMSWQDGGRLQHLAPSAALAWPELLAELRESDLLVAPSITAATIDASLLAAGSAHRCTPVTGVAAAGLFDERLPMTALAPEQLHPRYLMGSYAE